MHAKNEDGRAEPLLREKPHEMQAKVAFSQQSITILINFLHCVLGSASNRKTVALIGMLSISEVQHLLSKPANDRREIAPEGPRWHKKKP